MGRKRLPPAWSEVTAVFGGMFDPPHAGHVEAVRGLLREPGVREVLVMPTGRPGHKGAGTDPSLRLAMTKIAFAKIEGVTVDAREVNQAASDSRPTYTYDTLLGLTRERSQVAWVVGADQLGELHRWHRFPELLRLCHWIVLERRPRGAELARTTLQEWRASGLIADQPPGLPERHFKFSRAEACLFLCPTAAQEVASTSLREQLERTGLPADSQLIPSAVLEYIREHRLYGSSGGSVLGTGG